MQRLDAQQMENDIIVRLELSGEYIPASTISSSAISSGIRKIENSQVSRFIAINKPIKSKISSFFNRFNTKKTHDDTITKEQYSHLIGITVHPEVAQDFEGRIEFNGTGEIKSLRKNSIKEEDYNILIDNRIKALNETPQIINNRIRTPGEVIVCLAGLISYSGYALDNKHELGELIKRTWLDGELSRQSLFNMIELIKLKISAHPEMIAKIDDIMQTLEKDFFVTKRNDNYYGRLFETELSKYIIDNPSDNIITVRDAIRSFILDDFLKRSGDEQIYLGISMAKMMYADPPTWRYDLSCANKFIIDKTPESFIDMMKFTGHNSVPLALSVAVKYIVLSPGTRDIKNKATQYYVNKILPQRKLTDSLSDSRNIITTDYGLLLPYQKNYPAQKERYLGLGVRPIDKYTRPSAGIALTEHDAASLAGERTIGIGISGSSNILHFLFRELQSQDKDFPLDDAKLATASWLSYSGGHSFNEAYSVFGFMTEGNFKPLSFNVLKTSSALSEVAIAHAYNKVIEASIALNSSNWQ